MLLSIWEQGLGQAAEVREDALLRMLSDGTAAPRTLGRRNAGFVALHARLFGREMALLSHCPGCGTAVEFCADCDELAISPVPAEAAAHRLEADGYVVDFRLPDASDVAAASGESSLDRFARRLLERCVTGAACAGVIVLPGELPSHVADAVARRMESLDPHAGVSFALACPACSAEWDAPLDVGHLLWHKVRAAAERLLLDVDVLARAYGWTEIEVLRLSPARRAAYLQMVTA
jgi:hypothetical protein